MNEYKETCPGKIPIWSRVFIDKNGLMIQSLFRDGIHLNDAGYQVWVDYIYKYVESLSNNHRSAD